jgi:hypothetical protein
MRGGKTKNARRMPKFYRKKREPQTLAIFLNNRASHALSKNFHEDFGKGCSQILLGQAARFR